jgi:hypothetical protein
MSLICNLSIIISMFLTKESILVFEVEIEVSSLIVTLLYILCLALLANRFSSTLTTLFCISSKVEEFLSLSW